MKHHARLLALLLLGLACARAGPGGEPEWPASLPIPEPSTVNELRILWGYQARSRVATIHPDSMAYETQDVAQQKTRRSSVKVDPQLLLSLVGNAMEEGLYGTLPRCGVATDAPTVEVSAVANGFRRRAWGPPQCILPKLQHSVDSLVAAYFPTLH
jgi:hypothetical protein